MSYICEQCKKTIKHEERSFLIPVRARPKEYPYREKANRDGSDDPGGKGVEIAKEKRMCFECAYAHT